MGLKCLVFSPDRQEIVWTNHRGFGALPVLKILSIPEHIFIFQPRVDNCYDLKLITEPKTSNIRIISVFFAASAITADVGKILQA